MDFGIAVSTFPTSFGPIMFAGNLTDKLETIAHMWNTGLDLFIKSADEPGLELVLKEIKRNQLKVVIVAAVSAFVDEGLFLSSPDSIIRNKMIARMKKQLNLAADLEAMVSIGVLRGSEAGVDKMKWLAESLFVLNDYATPLGVKLLIEPVNRYETQMINSVQDALDFMTNFDLPAFDLLVDLFHMNIEDRNIEESLRSVGSRIGHVHFADSNRRVPGQGHLDWPKIIQTLVEIGYEDFCSVEAIPGKNPVKDAEQGIQFLQEVYGRVQQKSVSLA